jgi:hypothetical protein
MWIVPFQGFAGGPANHPTSRWIWISNEEGFLNDKRTGAIYALGHARILTLVTLFRQRGLCEAHKSSRCCGLLSDDDGRIVLDITGSHNHLFGKLMVRSI